MVKFLKKLFGGKAEIDELDHTDLVDPEVARHIANRNAEEIERVAKQRKAYENHRGAAVHPQKDGVALTGLRRGEMHVTAASSGTGRSYYGGDAGGSSSSASSSGDSDEGYRGGY